MHGLQEIIAMNETAYKDWQYKRRLEHLKHLLFNDWCSILRCGMMNHNANDRCTCYEVFEFHIKQGLVSFEEVRKIYLEEVRKSQEGVRDISFPSFTDMDSYAANTARCYLEWREKNQVAGAA